MNYYADKSRKLPRFFYRNLLKELDANSEPRDSIIARMQTELQNPQLRGDWLKLKWCLPESVRQRLSGTERQSVEVILDARRSRRNDKFLEVFPQCSDEFSFSTAFLNAAFGNCRRPVINHDSNVTTIGSCFARNIAVFLNNNGYRASAFQQSEDLNSPFSNAKMLSIAAADSNIRESYVRRWLEVIYPENMRDKLSVIHKQEVDRLEALKDLVRQSDVLIVTCGNIIDYFLDSNTEGDDPGPRVAPKFFSISSNEDVDIRGYLSKRLRESGSCFRVGSYGETVQALKCQYQALRTINNRAHIIFTLSPVPIDGALGIENTLRLGAVEIDCISKSVLRAALSEFLSGSVDERTYYFPSFEIVRWIAPNVEAPVFGNEDASSRHVSQTILNGVYRYFLHKFVSQSEDLSKLNAL